MIKRQHVWLLIAPVLFALADLGVTLYGQSNGYWHGAHDLPREATPSWNTLLRAGPAAMRVRSLTRSDAISRA